MPLSPGPELPRVYSMNKNKHSCLRVKKNNQEPVIGPVDTSPPTQR